MKAIVTLILVLQLGTAYGSAIDNYDKAVSDSTQILSQLAGTSTGTGVSDSLWNSRVSVLSIGIFVFAMLFFVVITVVVLRKSIKVDLMKLYVTPLIIFGSLYLVIIGYSAEQVAPIIGLLGTIVGYMLGRSERRAGSNQDRP